MMQLFAALHMSSIPTEKDWRGGFVERAVARFVFGKRRDELGLDGEHAYRQFFGKSHEEALEMFRADSLSRQEDLMEMPLPCFKFYVRAYIEYLNSDDSIGDTDGSICFFSLVRLRLNEILGLDEPLQNTIFDTVKFLGENPLRFEAESEINGSFVDQANKLLANRLQIGG